MSEEEKINGEYVAKIHEMVQAYDALDKECAELREKRGENGETICDGIGVKCVVNCGIGLRKDRLLKSLETVVKEMPATPIPLESPMLHMEPEPEKPKEKRCPSCGVKAARPDSKYCDYCGDEF